MKHASLLGVLASLWGCVSVPVESAAEMSSGALSQRVALSDSAALCQATVYPDTTMRGRLMIEAELSVRGITACPSGPVGSLSAGMFNRSRYDRSGDRSVLSSDRDCADFSDGAAAQKFFLALGGPASDPHDLDRDGDGLACEWGREMLSRMDRSGARSTIGAPTLTRGQPRTRTTRRCYTGPRGGTYTLTASGNRNYSGC